MSPAPSTSDTIRARDALAAIPADLSHGDWVRIAMAIKAAGLELEDFDQWSATAPDRYSAAACRDTWKSIKGSGGIGLGTLFHTARAHGWREHRHGQPVGLASTPPPRKAPQRPPQAPRPASPTGTTADYARALWAKVSRDDAIVAGHPYCQAKRIGWAAGAGRGRATGTLIGQGADCIVVPVRSPDGALVAVECLSEHRDGTGKFLRQSFGPKSQGWLTLGNDLDPHLPRYVVEGWATGAKMLEHLGGHCAVYVAFGQGRLRAVAEEIERRFPGSEVIVCTEAPCHG